MEEKLGVRLQEGKTGLERIISRIEKEDYNEFAADKVRVLSFLEILITSDNKKLKDTAMDIYFELAQIDPCVTKRFFKKFYKNGFIEQLKRIIKIINEEQPIEEKIDNLEEKLLKAQISFPSYNYDSIQENIQELIHDNARAIAQLLVSK